MPLPRKKDAGSSGAAILNLMRAHIRLLDVEEYTEPYTGTRRSDGATFTLDPRFSCTVEIIDDGQGGTDNGSRFFESFRYKQSPDGGWFNQQNSKLGLLTEIVKPNYFDDPSIPELTAEDLERFELLCSIKPKRNPSTGAVTGSTIDWETMMPLPSTEKVRAAAEQEEQDWEGLPF